MSFSKGGAERKIFYARPILTFWSSQDGEDEKATYTLEGTGAAMSCLLASASLVLLFYFFDQVAWILVVSYAPLPPFPPPLRGLNTLRGVLTLLPFWFFPRTVFSSFIALVYAFDPVANTVAEFMGCRIARWGAFSLVNVLHGCFSGMILVSLSRLFLKA